MFAPISITLALILGQASSTIKATTEGVLVSPDRKYVAYAMPGEGDCIDLVITLTRSRTKRLLKADIKNLQAILKRSAWGDTSTNKLFYWVHDVLGIVWVPSRPHTLAFGTSEVYNDDPRIALWSGPKQVKVLIRDRSMDNSFAVLGVARNGRTLYYTKYFDTMNTQKKGTLKLR